VEEIAGVRGRERITAELVEQVADLRDKRVAAT
jgi:hypothetical protein